MKIMPFSSIFHTKKSGSFLGIMILLLLSCNKGEESPLAFHEIATQTTPNRFSATQDAAVLEEAGCALPYLELFSNHFRHYRAVDPKIYFSSEAGYEDWMVKFKTQKMMMSNMGGLAPYAEQIYQQEKITAATRDLAVHIHESVSIEGWVEIDALIQDLTVQYQPDETNSDPLYCYVYRIALEIYQNYYSPGSASPRGGCDFKDFVKTVIEATLAGAVTGLEIAPGEIFTDSGAFILLPVGLALELTGAAIGGFFGAIIGVFQGAFSKNCDCSEVDGISILSEDDCDLTRTLYAFGAGDDAGLFHWIIEQGDSTAEFFTTVSRITVTQLSSTELITVSVASVCEDGETEAIEAENINFSTSTSSDLGQVGELNLSYACPYENQWGEYINNCFDIDADVSMTVTSSNEASGHLEYQFDLQPPGMGELIIQNERTIRITWEQTGNATLTVTATNSCSGLTETISKTMNVTN